ncbi:hypothetical protein [Aquariibacter albus]|uniref:Uncharacterized protein n=1 Tax=Aquariibacter albus TaxID=2759899 RepID=A0A839HPW9_9BURK|nr:hypothetical protein [Aquariibacter albus]MBB1161061.1 hypothetical protein [Aquariibacter albus]
MADASDVITSQHIESLQAVLKHADKALKLLETKAKRKVEYFVDALDRLEKERKALEGRIEKLKAGVAKLPRSTPAFTNLVKEVSAYAKSAEAESKQEEIRSYYFGKSKVGSSSALESKIKSVLPDKCKGNASQALNDVVAGEDSTKDASAAGSGVRHASSGKAGVSSCTLFCTYEEANKGLETLVTIVGVGSHQGSKSYQIHWSSISKLKVGSVFDL